jgi:outer membrane protein
VKNLPIVLNVILLVAVIALYIIHFTGIGTRNHGMGGETESGKINFVESSIAYINSDSLISNYDFFSELETKFNEKRDKLDAEYRNRAQGLQTEIANFQQNYNTMTISQARAIEEDLQKKQQNLVMYQEQLTRQLMEEEGKMNTELYDKVSDYLKGYGQDRNLQLVLTYTKGSGVLYANDSLNITEEVIQGLNEAYAVEKSGGARQKAAKPDSAAVK